MDIKIVTSLTLLCLSGAVLSSNPDSEMVQDPFTSPRDVGQRSMPLQKPDSLPDLGIISNPYYPGVKILMPIPTRFGTFWAEVGAASSHERIRIRDRGTSLEVTSVRNNRHSSPESGGSGEGQQDSVNISKVPSTRVNQNTNEVNKSNDRTVSNQSASSAPEYTSVIPPRRRAFIPSGQSNWNHGYGSSGVRRPMRQRPNSNKQNTRTHRPTSNVPPSGHSGRDGVSIPEAGIGKPLGVPGSGETFSVPPTRNGLSPDSNLFAGIVNDFAFKLVDAADLDQRRANFVVSPISIFAAAAIVYMAAEGRTKVQLEQALGLNDYNVHDETLHQGISDLLSSISPESNELRLANGLFLGLNYSVEQPFREDLKKYYAAELKNLNFNNHEATNRAISEWVSKSTGDMIKSMSTPASLPNGILLLNAIFFRGVWKTQFPLESTAYERFFTLDGREKEIPLMSLFREKLPFFRSEDLRHTFVKLPYSGDQVSMIVALPFRHEDSPMPTVTDQALCHIRDAMVERILNTVALPKFHLDHHTSLKEPLTDLGIRDIFGGSANFGKMRKQRDLFVKEILHKAVVDVNEQGTLASAATAVQIMPLSSYADEFVANHPFAFYILHEPSGLVLFYGKIFDLGEKPRAPASIRSQNMRVPTYNGGRMPQSSQSSSRERND